MKKSYVDGYSLNALSKRWDAAMVALCSWPSENEQRLAAQQRELVVYNGVTDRKIGGEN
jgi:hypothetical protein